MALLERGTAKINYETWGDAGDWVVLVNGHTRSLTDFRLFAKFLVDAGHRVVAFDNRGAGKTGGADFTLDDIVDDVVALLDELGIDRVHVLGISMGGAVTMQMARRYPGRVRSIVLVSTGPRFPHARTGQRPDMAKYFSPHFAETSPLLFKTLTKQTDGTAQAPGTLAQARAIATFDATAWLPSLEVPTLIVHGEDDLILPPDLARGMASAIPGARLVLIPRAGHLLLAESPRKLYEAAGEFFK